jgi:hypothetical protein
MLLELSKSYQNKQVSIIPMNIKKINELRNKLKNLT